MKPGMKQHFIDNMQLDVPSTFLCFLLPSHHSMRKERVMVCLFDSDEALVVPPLTLAEFEEFVLQGPLLPPMDSMEDLVEMVRARNGGETVGRRRGKQKSKLHPRSATGRGVRV